MKIVLASSNPHKLKEVLAVWGRCRELSSTPDDAFAVELVGLDDLDQKIIEPVEDQPTFELNAILKARYYARICGEICLADDSGLEVDALNGDPGVRSARYAGASGVSGGRDEIDQANNALLLKNLVDLPSTHRAARFVCAMALCQPNPDADPPPEPFAVVRGTIEGRIIGPGQPPRGRNGFGYDPLFEVPDLGKTTAELEPHEKNAISHRGDASRKMWDRIHRLIESNGLTGRG